MIFISLPYKNVLNYLCIVDYSILAASNPICHLRDVWLFFTEFLYLIQSKCKVDSVSTHRQFDKVLIK